MESAIWKQFDADYGQQGWTVIAPDCGYGIMQITYGMGGGLGFDPARVAAEPTYNIGTGAWFLIDNWNTWDHFVGDHDPYVVEDWYFAVWGYNGRTYQNNPTNPIYPWPRDPWLCWRGGQSNDDWPYQELIWGCAANPAEDPVNPGVLLWAPVPLTLPPRDLFWGGPPVHIDRPQPSHGSCSIVNLPIVTKAQQCSEIIQNGGFEDGSNHWVLSPYTVITSNPYHSGGHSAWLAGYNYAYDWMYQTVTIPAGTTVANLSYWWYMHTEEYTHPWDFLYVKIRGPSYTRLLEIIHDGSTPDTWVQSTFDISEFAGQTVDVLFEAETDGSLVTDFYIDDVSLQVCPGIEVPTPTPTPTNTPNPTTDWTFNGEVTSSTRSEPMPGANVTLYRVVGNGWEIADTTITGSDGRFTVRYSGLSTPGWFLILVNYPSGYAPGHAQPGPYFRVVHSQALIADAALPPAVYGGHHFFGQQSSGTPVPGTPTPPPLPTIPPFVTPSPSPTVISPLATPTP